MTSASKRSHGEGDLRARVLAAAVELIEKDGLAGLSMREVARLAGVSHQAPYHHFTDREAILAGIAEEGFSRLGEALRVAVSDADGASAPARTERAGHAYVHFALTHPAHFRVMFRADFVDMDRFPEAVRVADASFESLPTLVGALRHAGLEPEPSLDAHVALHWSVCHGLACLLLDGPLAKKVPRYGEGREAVIRDVMAAMRSLVEARLSRQGSDDGRRNEAAEAARPGARPRAAGKPTKTKRKR